ncbi:MAG: hypothetical protein ACYTEV_06795 [Planctomycetota bacterium]
MEKSMLQETTRNGLLLLLSILAGIAAGLAAGGFTGADGILQPTIAAAVSRPAALGAIVAAIIAAIVAGGLMSRAANAAVGLFVAGWAFFALAWRMEPVERAVLSGQSPMTMAAECVVWAAAAGIAWAIILRGSGGLADVEPTPAGDRPHPVWSRDAGRMALAAIAALPAAWVLARSPEPGQVIAAATGGGIAAGLAGRLAAPHVQPYLLVPVTVLVGGAALAFTSWRLGVSLPATARSSGLPPLGAIHGAAWAAGSMFGVAMGLGWARSFLHHEDEDAPAASARRRVSSVAGDGAG